MTKPEIITEHFARWVGHDHSITHDRNNPLPYIFRKDEWIRISKLDAEWYEKKAKKNATWEYKNKEGKPTIVIKMARFMGMPGKQEFIFKLMDHDEFGNTIPKTLREYVFKKGLWVKLLEKDVVRLKRKADSNTWWEFAKERVEVGKTPTLIKTQTPEKEKKEKAPKVETKTKE